jgi:nucleotide-binding universal stress UspA family protein
MTARRRAHLARWVLGSTADFVVQHAPVPVLLVHQSKE